MLSSLPKLADKAFILGFFIPVLLFFAGIFALFADSEWVHKLLEIATGKEATFDKLAIPIFTVWVVAVLTMLANHSLFRLLEGYLWPITKLNFLKERQRRDLDHRTKDQEMKRLSGVALSARFDNVAKQGDAGETKRVAEDLARAREEYAEQALELMVSFPPAQWVLPTRFGNTIRAFETYSYMVYGADSIPIWARLATVIPAEFQQTLEDARAQVNFLVNIVFFSTTLAFTALVRIIGELRSPELLQPGLTLYLSPEMGEVQVRLILALVGFAVIAWCAYVLSTLRARAWGELVKAAFDCYLPDLATRLGYQLPSSGDEQKRFWTDVSRQALYGIKFEPASWPRPAPNGDAPTPPANKAEPKDTDDGDDSG